MEVDTRGLSPQAFGNRCAAAFILHCLNSGKLPGWDAANPESAALAVQLGYRPDGVYTAYQLL
ncbi:MAG: GNAT family N-acetyltransferase [Oscillospiraceae bacterium]